MVFVDRSSGVDTINVFIPSNDAENNVTSTTADSSLNQSQPVAETSNPTTNETNNNTQPENTNTTTFLNSATENADTTSHAIENPFYKSNDQNTAAENTTSTVTPVTENSAEGSVSSNQPKITNSVNDLCIKMISDDELAKMKRKMFVQDNDDKMVQTAIKYLGNKCITTDQVKELGNIFSSDDGRYNLYDALYKSVYDYGNYAKLESQIIDPYYKRRFEAMLK
jgi:hypothetical protein